MYATVLSYWMSACVRIVQNVTEFIVKGPDPDSPGPGPS